MFSDQYSLLLLPATIKPLVRKKSIYPKKRKVKCELTLA